MALKYRRLKSGEVGRVPVTDMTAVQVALGWVDALRLPVGDDGTGGPVERARGLLAFGLARSTVLAALPVTVWISWLVCHGPVTVPRVPV